MKVTHIVGMRGCGKSGLARLIVADMESRGVVCAVVDSDTMAAEFKHDVEAAKAAFPQVEHLVLENYPHTFKGAKEGERVLAVWYGSAPEIGQTPASTTPPAIEVIAGQGA